MNDTLLKKEINENKDEYKILEERGYKIRDRIGRKGIEAAGGKATCLAHARHWWLAGATFGFSTFFKCLTVSFLIVVTLYVGTIISLISILHLLWHMFNLTFMRNYQFRV